MTKHLRFRRLAAALALAGLTLTALASIRTRAEDAALTPELKALTIDSLAKAMKDSYVFPDLAKKAEEALHAKQREGAYASVEKGEEMARLLTEHLNSVCRDAHLSVRYSEAVLPVRKDAGRPSPHEVRQRERFTRLVNAGFDKVERLDGNIGYIAFRGFQDAEKAARPIRAAMDFVADTDALIFDIRQNGGGSPETVRLLCSYLFGEQQVHLNSIYSRPSNKTEEFWTLKRVSGKRYLDKEVYVLVSKRTGSAAEEFSYNLKNLKRATIVGEPTWGGANPGHVVRLNDHFSAFIPTGRAINPITKTNWEGTGVEPDIKVAPADALKTAHVLALKRLLGKAEDPQEQARLRDAIQWVENGRGG